MKQEFFTRSFLADLADMTNRNDHNGACVALAEYIAARTRTQENGLIYGLLAGNFRTIQNAHNELGCMTYGMVLCRSELLKVLENRIFDDFGEEAARSVHACL